ncbi:MAG: membrane protein insertion efficiency factor YidD [Actinomycetota bacterium]|nr:membrane protein insertion efficiency factor YidD [Actinomycetota bacterium]
MTAVARLLVHAYRLLVSPLLGRRCKYYPSCSRYALDALEEYGFVRGSILSAWRLVRCNPWSHGGVDFASEQTLFRARAATSPRARRPA